MWEYKFSGTNLGLLNQKPGPRKVRVQQSVLTDTPSTSQAVMYENFSCGQFQLFRTSNSISVSHVAFNENCLFILNFRTGPWETPPWPYWVEINTTGIRSNPWVESSLWESSPEAVCVHTWLEKSSQVKRQQKMVDANTFSLFVCLLLFLRQSFFT